MRFETKVKVENVSEEACKDLLADSVSSFASQLNALDRTAVLRRNNPVQHFSPHNVILERTVTRLVLGE